MTVKEINDLVTKLHIVMNPVHRKYNQDLESKNLSRAHALCERLGVDEKRVVEYMLLSDRNIGIRYLCKYHKFTEDREIAQDTSLNFTITGIVYERDNGGGIDVVEKEVKKKLLSIFPMI